MGLHLCSMLVTSGDRAICGIAAILPSSKYCGYEDQVCNTLDYI